MYRTMEPFVAVKDYRRFNLIDPVIKPAKMSLKEVDWAIINCYRSFYMGKMKAILTMKDDFKRTYLLRSMKLIMSSSFIRDKLGSLGSMPPSVKVMLSAFGGDSSKVRPACPGTAPAAERPRRGKGSRISGG